MRLSRALVIVAIVAALWGAPSSVSAAANQLSSPQASPGSGSVTTVFTFRVRYDGAFYMPIFSAYPETTFGGEFPTEPDYHDPYIAEKIAEKGWMIFPPIPFNHRTVNLKLPVPAPAPPSAINWLGTDDQGRDVLARLIYGFRISVLFGLTLTLLSSIIGVIAGAVQGYFGGWIDLAFQRFIEI